jgi:hypothetical protein
MPRFVIFALIGFVSLASACAPSLTHAGAQIREAAPEGVTQCVFLGTVIDDSGQSAIEFARIDALNRAAERGTTHVVWVSVSASHGATAMARAYRCEAG